ncbi:hypothetical protein CDL15_Pgr006839 [Punica granatum]|uniref:Uncharacterized protein n=1 Tax=Punica granatum TaxID=22663 RepID=A0A218X7Y3_PUNGR|nr:hypothetical protein CDL15_Pgr006839 [Punica granatum]PKI56115.1 hypothetical protein CRG98_023505 [Punica granatum]
MLGRGPKAVNAGPEPESSKCRTEARYGAEAQKWGRIPKVGSKPDAGPKPKSGPEARCNKCGVGALCRAKTRCGAGAQCSKCVLDKKMQEMQKQWSMLRNNAGHCKAVTPIFLAVLLCGARMGT